MLARLLREDGVGELLTELLLSPSDSRLQLASSLQRVLCSGGQAAAAKAKPESPPVSEAQTAADPPATAALASEVLQLMRLHHLRRVAFTKHAKFAPPTRESEAGLGMDLGLKPSKRAKKDSDASIPLADAHLKTVTAPPEAPEKS